MKKGITMVSLTIALIIIVVLTSAVVVSTNTVVENSNKNKFVTEIMLIEQAVKDYVAMYGNYPENGYITIDLSKVSEKSLTQFLTEKPVNNILTLALIDYKGIGINQRSFGNNKDGENIDNYAISRETGKIYYLKGIKYKGEVYYTLTKEISSIEPIVEIAHYEVKREDCIFVRKLYGNIIPIDEYAGNFVNVEMYIPEEATNISIKYSNNEKSVYSDKIESDKIGYLKYVSNSMYNTRYKVTINYTLNGIDKTVNFIEDKIDSKPPVIDIDNLRKITIIENREEKTYIVGFKIYDELSSIKKMEYLLDEENNAKFSCDLANKIDSEKIDVTGASSCTIYAEDIVENTIKTTIKLENVQELVAAT